MTTKRFYLYKELRDEMCHQQQPLKRTEKGSLLTMQLALGDVAFQKSY